ncbi:MAG: DUF3784 domain-containing protein [Clostridiales bacterium]|jgi:hypothetical protein|nr:DUF3784 domain-containing protein [Clostridiales bacterium]
MVFLIPMVLLVVFGWLIKYKKVTWLISGYNTASEEKKKEYDIEKLCKYMGNFLFVLASVFFIMSVLSIVLSSYAERITIVGFVFLSIVIICGIIFMNTGNRVKK